MSDLVVVTSSFPRWTGDHAGRFVAASVWGLRQAGLKVQVLAPCDAQSRAQAGLRCFAYGRRSGASLAYGAGIMPNLRAHPSLIFQAPSLLLRMAQAIRQSAARHVVAHWLLPAGLGAIVAGVHNLVVIVHGSDLALLETMPMGGRIARFIGARCDALIFVSEDLRRRFWRLCAVPKSMMTTTTCVLPPTTFAPPQMTRNRALRQLGCARSDRRLLLFVGRVVEGKGLQILLRAMSQLPADVQLWVVGDGPELGRMRRLAARLELVSRVHFWKTLPPTQVSAMYALADIFVLPSRARRDGHAEGFPTVLIEAMAVGLPIVATRVGGVAEQLEDGRNAVLCAENNAGELIASIKKLLDRPQLARLLCQQARRDVQPLLPRAHGQMLLAILRRHWQGFAL